jgi:hypothetical protein
MGRLEDLVQQLPPAVQARVVQLIATLVACAPPGPKVAPPPTHGRPRPPRPAVLADRSHAACTAWADGLAIPCQDLQPSHADAPVLEALQARYPLVMTARHVTAMTGLPHPQVRATLQELARRGLIASPNEGSYRFVAKEPVV